VKDTLLDPALGHQALMLWVYKYESGKPLVPMVNHNTHKSERDNVSYISNSMIMQPNTKNNKNAVKNDVNKS